MTHPTKLHLASRAIPRPRTAAPEPVEGLLHRRAELGADLMCRLCHGMAASMEPVLAVETTLTTRWPRRFSSSIDEWSVDDAGYIHDPLSNPHPGCRYCHPGKDTPQHAGSELDTAA